MKLTELDAQLLRHERKKVPKNRFVDGIKSPSGIRDSFHPAKSLAQAHGIRFLCPKSFAANGGRKGTHSVYVWFEGSPVPPEIGTNTDGQTVRWKASGASLQDLTLTPSILEQGGECQWHGFVTNGDAA